MATIHDHESRIAQLEAELAKANAWAKKVSMVREELIQRLDKASSLFEDYVSQSDAKLADAIARAEMAENALGKVLNRFEVELAEVTNRAERAEKALVELHDALDFASTMSTPAFGVGESVSKYDRPEPEPCISTNGWGIIWQNEAPHAYEWVKAREQEAHNG